MRPGGGSNSRPAATHTRRLRAAALLLASLLCSGGPLRAVDVNGAYSVIFSSTETEAGNTTDFQNQQASLGLFQTVTPFLSARFNFQYAEFDSESFTATEFTRRTREPTAELLYSRKRLAARLAVRDRRTDGTALADNFEQESLFASLSWRPSRGPSLAISFRDESNLADVGVFGRNTDSTFFNLETRYDRTWGGLSYSFGRSDLDNPTAGFDTTQQRHQVRATAFKAVADGRVSLDGAASLSRLDRRTSTGPGAELAEPVPATQGLYELDTTPEIGELPPAPGLIDGNVTVPSAPGIDIGGGNTLRNVGVDLGLKVQVTRLEVTVDAVSGPDLQWEVYSSPDNLIWQPVPGIVVSEFDVSLLRYTLRFDEVTERYFKAVNVSVNPEPLVRVTELRALLDVPVTAAVARIDSTLYRVDTGATFRAGDRLSGRVNVGFSTDEEVSASLVRRDFDEVHAGLSLRAELASKLRLNLGYRFTDSENRRDPVLLRTEHAYNAGLTWTPLPTIDTLLTVQRRDEEESGDRLQSSESARLLVATTILPDLRLITDASIQRTDDPFSGIDRKGWTWRERLSARPLTRWILGLFYGASSFETDDGGGGLDRTDRGVSSTWIATPFLSLSGSWSLNKEDDRKTIRQSYSLSYHPGPKLNVSGSYSASDTRNGFATDSGSLSINYRMNNHLTVFGSATRSRAEQQSEDPSEITSVQSGLRFVI